MIRLIAQAQLLDVLDRHDALVARDLEDQRLGDRRLARAGGAGQQDVLALLHGLAQEADEVALAQQRCQRVSLSAPLGRRGSLHLVEDLTLAQLLERPQRARGPADGDRHGAVVGGWRQHDLHALAAGQRRRQQRLRRGHALLGEVGDQPREREAPVVAGPRERLAGPAAQALDEGLVRAVDADLGDVGVVEQRAQRLQEVVERRRLVRRVVRRLGSGGRFSGPRHHCAIHRRSGSPRRGRRAPGCARPGSSRPSAGWRSCP